MAKDILSLEKQIMLLENKKNAQLLLLKSDVSTFVDAIKPGNLLKLGFNDLISGGTNGTISPAFTGIAGVLGTFLLDRFVLKRSGFIYKILAGILASGVVNDIASGENSFLKKWVTKLKDKFVNKENVSIDELFNEEDNSESFTEDTNING